MSGIFSTSIGRKLVMSLAGLFLVTFLLVHLGINLLLVFDSTREAFNIAAHFMATNPLIKIMEVVLFGGILVHMVYAGILTVTNKKARGGVGYKIANSSQTSYFSKYMVHTAVIVGIFLVLHIYAFYIRSKFLGAAQEISINGKHYHDMGLMVIESFKMLPVVIFYLVSFLALGFHLHHGFQSAFQTLGINHKSYTPFIKKLGVAYTILVTGGFILIPLYVYFTMQ
ncbi:MAG: succinate dehydrogenase cytochrome b subunit [Bacteroidales bacterium]|nr:succinate dehydrogenase cytochrome b subunit [Bacteroidales bacterium]